MNKTYPEPKLENYPAKMSDSTFQTIHKHWAIQKRDEIDRAKNKYKTYIVEVRLNCDVMVCAPSKEIAEKWAEDNRDIILEETEISWHNMDIESVYESQPRPSKREDDDEYGGIYFVGDNGKSLARKEIKEVLESGD